MCQVCAQVVLLLAEIVLCVCVCVCVCVGGGVLKSSLNVHSVEWSVEETGPYIRKRTIVLE